MPQFTIQLPDGRTMVAEAPSEAEAMAGAQSWYADNPAASAAAGARGASELQGYQSEADMYPSAAEAMSSPQALAPISNLTDIAQKVAQGVSAGYADELGAAAGSLPNLITGGRYGRTRQEILDEIRGRERTFETEHPEMAGAAELGGGLGMGLLTGGLGLGNAPGIMRGLGVGALTSGTQASVAATGRMEGDHTAGEYLGEAAEAAALPAIFGGALGAGAAGIGRMLTPGVADEAQPLLDRGVDLTPGEIMGGYWKRLEDSAGSAPFLGAMVRGRQREATESFNRAAWDEALTPIRGQGQGARMPADTEMGHEAQQRARSIFQRRYSTVVPRLRAVADPQFVSDVSALEMALPRRVRGAFTDDIQRHVLNNFDAPIGGGATQQLTGEALQDSLQGLRKRAIALRRNPGNADEVELADALDRTRTLIEGLAGRSSPRRALADFRRLNQAYRNYITLRQAGSSVGAEGGVFSPAQLHNAVKSADQTVGKGAFARGEAPMQDLSDNAKTVMTRRVSDSGTPERSAIMGAVLAPGLALKGLAAAAPIAGMYTRTGSDTFRRLAMRSPAAKAAIRRRMARFGVTTGLEGETLSRSGDQ
jgi:hypothetical protein